jgi:hemoglobin-like flavoprotein
MDVARLQASFALVAKAGDEVAVRFYSELFLRAQAYPGLRRILDLFPASLQAQRAHLLEALAKIAGGADRLDEVTGYLATLGADHRHYGAQAGDYPAVGAALIATLAHFAATRGPRT